MVMLGTMRLLVWIAPPRPGIHRPTVQEGRFKLQAVRSRVLPTILPNAGYSYYITAPTASPPHRVAVQHVPAVCSRRSLIINPVEAPTRGPPPSTAFQHAQAATANLTVTARVTECGVLPLSFHRVRPLTFSELLAPDTDPRHHPAVRRPHSAALPTLLCTQYYTLLPAFRNTCI